MEVEVRLPEGSGRADLCSECRQKKSLTEVLAIASPVEEQLSRQERNVHRMMDGKIRGLPV